MAAAPPLNPAAAGATRRRPGATAAVAAIMGFALLLVAYFDLRAAVPMSDEWMFWFPLQSLRGGHGFQLWPGVLPLSLVQLGVALPLVSAPPPVWRLTELPFLALAALCAQRLARRLGADQFWALAAAATVACAPVTLSVTTGFTSDIAYLGLLLAAALLAARRLEGQGSAWPLVAVVFLATLQRQHGLLITPALAVAALARGRRDAAMLRLLGLMAAATVVGVVASFALGSTKPTKNGLRSNSGRLGPSVGSILGAIVVLGPMLGLFALPLVPGLLRGPAGRGAGGRQQLVPVALWAASLGGAAAFLVIFGGNYLPGNVLGIWGLGPTHLGGHKPPLLGLAGYLALEAVVFAGCTVVLLGRRRELQPRAHGAAGVFLLTLGLAHLLPMPATSPLDRYFIDVTAPVVPVLAALASKSGRLDRPGGRAARVATVALLAVGVALYAVGEQDYQAWEGARETAALLAYTRLDPARVEAGYEAVANHAAVPEYLRTGRVLIDPIDLKPPDPVLRLEFASPGDPRPGFEWSSLRPGRVVLVCLVPTRDCAFPPPR